MQKLWKSRRAYGAVAAFALVGTLGLTACGTDDSSDETSTSSATSEAAPQPALPEVADLQAVIDRALDPAIPADQKLDTVQEGEQAPELFDTFSNLVASNNATIVVNSVTGGMQLNQVDAISTLTAEGLEPATVPVSFVDEEGVWKITKDFVCGQISTFLESEEVPEQVTVICAA